MKKKIVVCMLALTLTFSMTACGNEKGDDTKETSRTEQQEETDEEDIEEGDETDEEEITVTADRGTFDGKVYTNESMGIQVTFPEGFRMYSEEEIAQVVNGGMDTMGESFDSEALEQSMSGTIYDVIAETEDGTVNIQLVIEDTEVTTGMKIPANLYAQALINNLKVGYSGAGIDIGEPAVEDVTLGDLDFKVVTISAGGMTQSYYIHQVENNMMLFTITSVGGTKMVEEFLNSVTAL